MKKKYAYSLMELMVVIFLIGLIAATIGYSIKGSFNKGKEFKTTESARQIRDILLLEVATGTNIDLVISNYQTFLERSGLAKDVNKLVLDGWGNPFIIQKNGNDIEVISEKLQQINQAKDEQLKDMGKNEASQSVQKDYKF